MRRKDYFQFKRFLNSNLFIFVGGIILVFLVMNWVKVASKDYLVKRQIEKLEKEVERLEAEQRRLINLRDFFKSDFFIEEESRRKLGYAKPGEEVIIIDIEKSSEASSLNGEPESRLSNPQKWWKYFFEHDKI